MSIPAGNGATGAPGTGPALGYLLNLFWFNYLFMLISENNMNTCTLSLIYIIKLLVIFGIKIYQKLPIILTIQKPDFVNRLSVSSFAASIKPPPFDGSNYKRWQERLILWLTLSRVIHVKEGVTPAFLPYSNYNTNRSLEKFFRQAQIAPKPLPFELLIAQNISRPFAV
jgi:hypothetical protein